MSKRESQTTKELRRFVESEFGLDAIHSGMSEEAIDGLPDHGMDETNGTKGEQGRKRYGRMLNLREEYEDQAFESKREVKRTPQ